MARRLASGFGEGRQLSEADLTKSRGCESLSLDLPRLTYDLPLVVTMPLLPDPFFLRPAREARVEVFLTCCIGIAEEHLNYDEIITIEPGKRGGQPCIRGMRITVADVLSYLAGGLTEDEILSDFPELTHEDILACLSFDAQHRRTT